MSTTDPKTLRVQGSALFLIAALNKNSLMKYVTQIEVIDVIDDKITVPESTKDASGADPDTPAAPVGGANPIVIFTQKDGVWAIPPSVAPNASTKGEPPSPLTDWSILEITYTDDSVKDGIQKIMDDPKYANSIKMTDSQTAVAVVSAVAATVGTDKEATPEVAAIAAAATADDANPVKVAAAESAAATSLEKGDSPAVAEVTAAEAADTVESIPMVAAHHHKPKKVSEGSKSVKETSMIGDVAPHNVMKSGKVYVAVVETPHGIKKITGPTAESVQKLVVLEEAKVDAIPGHAINHGYPKSGGKHRTKRKLRRYIRDTNRALTR